MHWANTKFMRNNCIIGTRTSKTSARPVKAIANSVFQMPV